MRIKNQGISVGITLENSSIIKITCEEDEHKCGISS
jgi:hypothetical protein